MDETIDVAKKVARTFRDVSDDEFKRACNGVAVVLCWRPSIDGYPKEVFEDSIYKIYGNGLKYVLENLGIVASYDEIEKVKRSLLN